MNRVSRSINLKREPEENSIQNMTLVTLPEISQETSHSPMHMPGDNASTGLSTINMISFMQKTTI